MASYDPTKPLFILSTTASIGLAGSCFALSYVAIPPILNHAANASSALLTWRNLYERGKAASPPVAIAGAAASLACAYTHYHPQAPQRAYYFIASALLTVGIVPFTLTVMGKNVGTLVRMSDVVAAGKGEARLALNFKGIPYVSEWIEYPDVAPTFKSWYVPTSAPLPLCRIQYRSPATDHRGIPPAEPPATPYTIPTLRLPNDNLLMDSKKIAHALEEKYPTTPPLHLDSEVLPRVEALLPKIMGPLAPVFMPQVPTNILNPASAQYFEKTRAERFGMSLPELAKQKGGEQAWEAGREGIMEMAGILREKGGPYVLGETPSYADFVVMGLMQFARRLNESDFKRLVDHDPAFMRLYDACAKWLEPDH
ncbi:MAG: hypothetical protein M1828_006219 [Chrysothrix sp. TS-e1954]|nr:MAG: hypothetical protein M1828_006219 [Chrysothrix sp. TS-e1954]